MKKILDLEKTKKYIAKTEKISIERAGEYIDNGVENMNWLNIKYLGYGNFEVDTSN